jgi:hypothetical protein
MPDTSGLIFWAGAFFLVFAVLVTAFIYGARALGRRMRQQQQTGPTFTIQDLREMHAQGQISEQEFEAMKAIVLRTYGAGEGRLDDAGGGDDEPDGVGQQADSED